jgi:hypothetical protein
MRRARFLRGTLGGLLTGLVASAGCTHNYYYGAAPVACAPGTTATAVAPGTVQYGSLCDWPARLFGGGTVVVASPGVRSSVTTTAPPSSNSSDVVVSEPVNRPRLSWRRSDPESSSSVATTRVEGAINSDQDSAVK